MQDIIHILIWTYIMIIIAQIHFLLQEDRKFLLHFIFYCEHNKGT